VDGDGFVDGGQGLLAAAAAGKAVRLVVQRCGEVREERVGPAGGELAVGGGCGGRPAATAGTGARVAEAGSDAGQHTGRSAFTCPVPELGKVLG
jgi:hypothetical protein